MRGRTKVLRDVSQISRGWPGGSCLAARPVAEQAGVISETKRGALASGRPRVEARGQSSPPRPAEATGSCHPDRTRHAGCEMTSVRFGRDAASSAPVRNEPMTNDTQKLSVVEKVGYGLGDTAANFIFQTMVMFQLAFYTDTFGITAAAAGTLLVVVRVWDAIFDPIMGVVADRTNTRWGKFRPWVLWTAVPFGVMGFLTFMTPDLSPSGKLIYAYVTYIALMMVYSANNLPYSALSGVMTGDLAERTSLSSYRFVCAMLAQLVIQGLALPMVHHFGQGNNAKGYQV